MGTGGVWMVGSNAYICAMCHQQPCKCQDPRFPNRALLYNKIISAIYYTYSGFNVVAY